MGGNYVAVECEHDDGSQAENAERYGFAFLFDQKIQRTYAQNEQAGNW